MPAAAAAAVCLFPSLPAAASAVALVLQVRVRARARVRVRVRVRVMVGVTLRVSGGDDLAVALVLQSGVPVARCEILDTPAVAAFNAYAREVPDLVAGPTLLFEFEGTSEAAVAEQAEIGLP